MYALGFIYSIIILFSAIINLCRIRYLKLPNNLTSICRYTEQICESYIYIYEHKQQQKYQHSHFERTRRHKHEKHPQRVTL